MTATLAWMLIAHGIAAISTVTKTIHSSMSTLRLPHHAGQYQSCVDMQPAVCHMLLNYFDCPVGFVGGKLVDVRVPVNAGNDSDKRSKA